ncbi:hypothetical protein EI94DRAFT_1682735 [Lactarius quietus]|nr:hypothetical protein EI94DRAFT_1682735 [Lactarius quietus]
MSNPSPFSQPSFFPTHTIDHAFAGIGAGTFAEICMNPLDLLKVKFQVSTRRPEGGIGRALYRGLGPNIAGNASSWGLCFSCAHGQPKRRATVGAPDLSFSVLRYLHCSAEASLHYFSFLSTLARVPLMILLFETCRDGHSYEPDMGSESPDVHCAARHMRSAPGPSLHGCSIFTDVAGGFRAMLYDESWRGLYRGMSLTLFGISVARCSSWIREDVMMGIRA